MAWKRVTHEESDTEEYENVGKVHLKSASISNVSAVLINENCIKIHVQVKAGYIKTFLFNNYEFYEENGAIPCGTYTFCRMDTLRFDNETLISYPSTKLENAINVLIEGKSYLLKNFMSQSQSTGMCLFTKLYAGEGEVVLMICGYESGKLIVLKLTPSLKKHEIIFEERIFEESCTSADLFNETIVAVSAGKSVKIIRNFTTETDTIELPFPGFNAVAIRSDGKLFVTGGWDGKLRYFSMKSGKLLAIIDHHFDSISDIKFRNDFELLAACIDGTISLWTPLYK